MKELLLIVVLALSGACCPAPSSAQTPAASPSSKLGFSYTVPSDWEIVASQADMDQKKAEASQNAGTDEEKKGLACLEPILTARQPKTGSVLLVEALPFDCFGHELSKDDLPGFAAGAPEVLKQNFDIGEPVSATYSLGSHSMWIERAKASLKGHPEVPFTVEITCGLLKKAAVCWMAVTADDQALQAFEHGSVTLDGETLAALVPATAFDKKPS